MSVFKSPKRKIFRKKKDVDDLILFSDMLITMVEDDRGSVKWFTDRGTRFIDTNGWIIFKDCVKKLLPLILVFLLGCSVTPVTKFVPPIPSKSLASESGVTSVKSVRMIPKFKSFTESGARNVMFLWDHEHPETVDFYKLYYGFASRSYTNFAVSLSTNLMFEAKTNAAYYYAVTAHSTNGLESDFSSELIYPRHLEPRTNVVVVTMWSTNGTDWMDLKRETNAVNGVIGLWKLRVE